MSKIGVGVGEDFPVDDGPPKSGKSHMGDDAQGHGTGHCGFDYGEYRWRRHEWRQQRREWKRKWKDYARERMAYDRQYGPYPHPPLLFGLRFGLPFALIPLIGIAIFVAFITALFRFPFMLLALLVGGYLYVTHRRHHRFYAAGGYARDDAPDDHRDDAPDETAMRDVTPPRNSQANPQD